MNISDVLKMPIGQKFGGFDVVIKTTKKKWQVKNEWMHQVVLSDESGDVLADVNIEKNIPLQRNAPLHIVVGIVQSGGDIDKKLYIDQFALPADIGEPVEFNQTDKITRSKIKCWLVSACIQSDSILEINKDRINELVDFIME